MVAYLHTFIYALNKKSLGFPTGSRDFVYLAKRQDIYNASFTDPSSELKASASPGGEFSRRWYRILPGIVRGDRITPPPLAYKPFI